MNEIIMMSEKLSPLVQEKELEISDNIKDLPPIISILENGFIELKELVSGGYATIFRTN